MDFQRFLREVRPEIEFLYPENPIFGLALFFMAIVRQVVEKDNALAERIVKHLKDMTPLIKLRDVLNPDKKWCLAEFKLPDMRGRVKAKRLQNISEEYRDIYEKVKPIFKRRYRNPEAKLHSLKERLGKNIPKDKLREWLGCEPREFSAKCLAYKHKWDKHPETILRYIRKERKHKPSTFDLISELAAKNAYAVPKPNIWPQELKFPPIRKARIPADVGEKT